MTNHLPKKGPYSDTEMINNAYLSSLKYPVIYDETEIFLSGKWVFIISNYLYNKYILY